MIRPPRGAAETARGAAWPRDEAPLKVAAKDLRPDDLCIGSGQRIVSVTPYGVDIPAGKVEVRVETKRGDQRVRYWNRETRIGVSRACAACGGSGVATGPDIFGNYDPCDACEGRGRE